MHNEGFHIRFEGISSLCRATLNIGLDIAEFLGFNDHFLPMRPRACVLSRKKLLI
jgi:hypothetical protein